MGIGVALVVGFFTPSGAQLEPICDAPIGSFQRCLLRDANWEQRVYIEKGVGNAAALSLLIAVRDGRVTNKLPPPTVLRPIDVSRIFQIRLGRASDGLATDRDKPIHQFVLVTEERVGSQSGWYLLVNLRDGDIEVVADSFWIA